MLRFCCIGWWEQGVIIQIGQQILLSIMMKLQEYEIKVSTSEGWSVGCNSPNKVPTEGV